MLWVHTSMSGGPDYYAILGLPRGASGTAIRRAFRRLAKVHHPDVSASTAAAQRFRLLVEAYQVLSDPQRRAVYDVTAPASVAIPAGLARQAYHLASGLGLRRHDRTVGSTLSTGGTKSAVSTLATDVVSTLDTVSEVDTMTGHGDRAEARAGAATPRSPTLRSAAATLPGRVGRLAASWSLPASTSRPRRGGRVEPVAPIGKI